MTNIEKLREVFPNTIFIYRKEDDKTTALMCSDEWLESEYKAPDGKDAYIKGYEDGAKSVNICPRCGGYIGEEVEV